jgi:hypothetical protein
MRKTNIDSLEEEPTLFPIEARQFAVKFKDTFI